MATKKDNIKALFSNTRTRIIIGFTGLMLFVIIAVGLVNFWSYTHSVEAVDSADIKHAPTGIRSIPGSLDPTNQYAALQDQQNIQQAQNANKTGGSAIPTIVRTYAFGEGVDMIGPKNGKGSVGFTTLAMTDDAGSQQSLWIQSLKNAACSQSALQTAVSQGATLSALHGGCTCLQLRDYGYKLNELNATCSCAELKQAGFSASELKAEHYTAERLKRCGYSACEVRGAGFSAEDMKNAGFSDGELLGAGFNEQAIDRAGGLPASVTPAMIRQAGCNSETLRQLKAQGVSASAIVRISGCSIAQLKAAGFNASALKAAGFSAAELKASGFSAADLKEAGFDPRDLLNAGFTSQDLVQAGFKPEDIKAALAKLPPGVTVAQLKAAGCSINALTQERIAGVSASALHASTTCTPAQLRQAGFSNAELAEAGFTPEALSAPDMSVAKDMDVNSGSLGVAGAIAALKSSHCSVASLQAARALGVSVATIRETAGCDVAAMKAAGFSVEALKAGGFSAAELKAAGFNPTELKAAGFDAKALSQAGFSAAELKAAGFDAKALSQAGFSAAELKAAGFDAKALAQAGFNAAELKAAGFDAKALAQAGFSAADLQVAGFDSQALQPATLAVSPLTATAALPSAVGMNTFPAVVTSPGNNLLGLSPKASQTKLALQQQTQQLQKLMSQQQQHANDQRYQADMKKRASLMLAAAQQELQQWKKPSTQVFINASEKEDKKERAAVAGNRPDGDQPVGPNGVAVTAQFKIKSGDILFAVIDTSVNTDEPGPILATIVSGQLKGSKLIGSFVLPGDADKMVINFKTISIPSMDSTHNITAYAIDPDTARTALSSETNHHYLARYGALFASSFLEGMSSAIQSANTTIAIGGTGGVTDTTVSTLSRSTLDNALIGLGQVGKDWSKTAQKQMSRPTTVQVYSGTGIGVLFTQDVMI